MPILRGALRYRRSPPVPLPTRPMHVPCHVHSKILCRSSVPKRWLCGPAAGPRRPGGNSTAKGSKNAGSKSAEAKTTEPTEVVGAAEKLRESLVYVQDLDRTVTLFGYSVLRSAGLTLVCTAAAGYVYWISFREDIKGNVAGGAADVAQRALNDEDVIRQANKAAATIIQEVITDKNTMALAEAFLTQITSLPSTQAALHELLMNIVNDPNTLEIVTALALRVVKLVLDDPATRDVTVEFLRNLFAMEGTQEVVVQLVQTVLATEAVRLAATDLSAAVVAAESVQEKANALASAAAISAVNDPVVRQSTRLALKSVLMDDQVHKTGGDAIWNSVAYSLTPSWFMGNNTKEEEEDSGEAAPTKVTPPQTNSRETPPPQTGSEATPLPHAPAKPSVHISPSAAARIMDHDLNGGEPRQHSASQDSVESPEEPSAVRENAS